MNTKCELIPVIQRFLETKGYRNFAPKAVFYDMDGVLFDSMPYHAQAWTEVMQSLDLPFQLADAYMHEGRTGKDTINTFFRKYKNREATEDVLNQVYERKATLFNSIYKVRTIPGVIELMDFIKSYGIKAYLVTGSGQKSLLDTLNTWFPGYFDHTNMVTAFDVEHGKPNPEPYLRALAKSGLQPNEVFVVENAPLGVQAAVAAGLFTFAVNTGILSDQVLADECRKSGVVLHSMKELKQTLDSLPHVVYSEKLKNRCRRE